MSIAQAAKAAVKKVGTTLIGKAKQTEAERKEAARVEYITLLARNDSPKAGDAERFAECRTVLGKAVSGLQPDVEWVEERKQTQAKAAGLDEAGAEYKRLHDAYVEVRDESERVIKKAEAKRDAAHTEWRESASRVQQKQRAREGLREHDQARPDLSGVAVPEPVAEPTLQNAFKVREPSAAELAELKGRRVEGESRRLERRKADARSGWRIATPAAA